MKVKVFKIPVETPTAFEDEMNAFLAAHAVSRIEWRFVEDGAGSFWSARVEYVEGAARMPGKVRKDGIDYRPLMSEEEFALFGALRTLRKEQAEREKVELFQVATNHQLATMVTERVQVAADFARVKGFGETKVAKYGEEILKICAPVTQKLGPPRKLSIDEPS